MSDYGQPLVRPSRKAPRAMRNQLAREDASGSTSGQPLERDFPAGQPLARDSNRGTPLARDSQGGQAMFRGAMRSRDPSDAAAPMTKGQAPTPGGQPLAQDFPRRGQAMARAAQDGAPSGQGAPLGQGLGQELRRGQGLTRDMPGRQQLGQQRGQPLAPSAGQQLQRKAQQRQALASSREALASPAPRADLGQAISRETQRQQVTPSPQSAMCSCIALTLSRGHCLLGMLS